MKTLKLKVYTENLLAGAPKVPDCSVDMIFTSPPYKRKDGLSIELMEILGQVAGRVLRPGGRFYMNFGQLRPEGFDKPFEARDLVQEHSGLKPGQTIAWVKSLALPSWRRGAQEVLADLNRKLAELRKQKPSDELPFVAADLRCQALARIANILEAPGEVLSRGHSTSINKKSPTLTYCWEPIFTFYKPPELALDRLSIGCAYADKSNLKRGTRGKDGDVKCAGDTWWVPYKTTGATKKKATATMGNAYSFPVELPRRAIKLSKLARGCVIFDPFLGSGTTAVAARQLGMHAWGIELDPGKVPVIQQRWREAVGDGQEGATRVDL